MEMLKNLIDEISKSPQLTLDKFGIESNSEPDDSDSDFDGGPASG